LTIDIDVGESVPTTFVGDPNRIRQVLFNLVNNALKFTNAGFVKISLAKEKTTAQYFFTVCDSGQGIEAEAIPNLFTTYFQVSASTARKYGGTGLGTQYL